MALRQQRGRKGPPQGNDLPYAECPSSKLFTLSVPAPPGIWFSWEGLHTAGGGAQEVVSDSSYELVPPIQGLIDPFFFFKKKKEQYILFF